MSECCPVAIVVGPGVPPVASVVVPDQAIIQVVVDQPAVMPVIINEGEPGQPGPPGEPGPPGPPGPGNTRLVLLISTNTTAAAAAKTDYTYACTATLTLTLPTAVGNSNVYTVKRTGTGNVTVGTTGGQRIDGAPIFVLDKQYMSIDVMSDGTNWMVI